MIVNDFLEKFLKLHDEDKFFLSAKVKGPMHKREKAYKQGRTSLFKSLRNQITSEIRVFERVFVFVPFSRHCRTFVKLITAKLTLGTK